MNYYNYKDKIKAYPYQKEVIVELEYDKVNYMYEYRLFNENYVLEKIFSFEKGPKTITNTCVYNANTSNFIDDSKIIELYNIKDINRMLSCISCKVVDICSRLKKITFESIMYKNKISAN